MAQAISSRGVREGSVVKRDAILQAARELFGNAPAGSAATDAWPLQHPVTYVLLFVVVMLVVFVPLSIRRFATLSR